MITDPASNRDMPDPVLLAMAAYRQERLNCAQSILRGFQKPHGIPEEVVIQAKKFGGGRAVDGQCGALYSAMKLIGGGSSAGELAAAFAARAGSKRCREIRLLKMLNCAQCVELAATLLDRHYKHLATTKAAEQLRNCSGNKHDSQ